jgi:glycosyltransferase involved in cell wall biosynthesis
MKVVILSTATSYTGGAIITLLNVLPLLQKEGVEPYFILKGHGQLEDVLRNRKIPYSVIKSYDWCVPEQKTKGLKNVVAWKIKSLINLIAEYKTYFLLKREKAELYHLNCIYNGTGVSSAKVLGIPVVWHLREFVDLHGETPVFWNTVEAWKKINRSDRVICVSNYLEQAYKNKIQDGSKLQVIYDGINMSCFKAKTKTSPKEKIVIGLAGTAPIKNHKDAILALKKVHDAGYHVTLKIAGKWSMDNYNQSYKSNLEKLIVENELKNSVEFIGMQSDMNMFWSECDLSVVCSKRESFGLAATEAMACGVPLICSNTSISGELTENGKNVFVYQLGKSEELAECILKCIEQLGTDKLDAKIKRAAAFVRNNFSIEESAKKLEAVYVELAGK